MNQDQRDAIEAAEVDRAMRPIDWIECPRCGRINHRKELACWCGRDIRWTDFRADDLRRRNTADARLSALATELGFEVVPDRLPLVRLGPGGDFVLREEVAE